MKKMLHLFTISFTILFVAGCLQMIPLYTINNHSVGRELSQQQVKVAIMSGAHAAGWSAQDTGPGKILAIKTIRTHTVAVDVTYTEKIYSINYTNSVHMKVHCSEQDKLESRVTVTGTGVCSDSAQPAYIHITYRKWIEQLNTIIIAALSSI